MTLFQKFGIAVSATALSLAAIDANPAQAATITYDFEVNLTSGRDAGSMGEGFFSYDDSILTGIGLETVGVNDVLSVQLELLGITYTKADTNNFGGFGGPVVRFEDGNLLGLFWRFQGSVTAPQVINNNYYVEEACCTRFNNEGEVTYTLRSTSIPESGTILSLSIFGLGFLLSKKLGQMQRGCNRKLSKNFYL